MHGRPLLYVIILVVELGVVATFCIDGLTTGNWDLGTPPGTFAVPVVLFGLLLTGLGRRRDGRVGSIWILLLVLVSAVLVFLGFGVFVAAGVLGKVISIIMALAVILMTSSVAVENRRGRLGRPRQT